MFKIHASLLHDNKQRFAYTDWDMREINIKWKIKIRGRLVH